MSETINSAYIFIYLYDEAGSPIGIKFRRANYAAGEYDYFFFEKNLQGDIVAIYNESGAKVATYTYDAWGKVTTTYISTNSIERYVANNNPFRYRGYYYDLETGLYYLQSRYYNPTWGRFLNADSALYSNILGFNLFAYCYNNPVNYVDYYGENATAAAAATTWLTSAWWLTLVDGILPVGDAVYGVGAVISGIIIIAAASNLADQTTSLEEEPTNPLPAPNEVGVEMKHVMNEHHPSNGKRPDKDKFKKYLTRKVIKRLVKEAYEDAYENYPSSLNKRPQFDNKNGRINYRVKGKSSKGEIEIWVDAIGKKIHTAYPKNWKR